MASKSLARDTVVVVIVKVAILLVIGFVFFGSAQRPHVDMGEHLLAPAAPTLPNR